MNNKDKDLDLFPVNEMNELFKQFFENPLLPMFETHNQVYVYDMEDKIVVEAELLGYQSDQIRVESFPEGIKISAEDNQEMETIDENSHFIKKEMSSKTMKRFVHIPYDMDKSPPIATYSNGILEVIIPKDR